MDGGEWVKILAVTELISSISVIHGLVLLLLEDDQDGRTSYSQRVRYGSHRRVDLFRDRLISGDSYGFVEGGGLCFPRGLGSLDRIELGDPSGALDLSLQQAEMAALSRVWTVDSSARSAETLRVMRDMRREMSDMQAELLAHREQHRRARQPGPDARIPDHQDASGDADSHI
ncbi:hypothetical protein Tco_0550901 [Tanacetum coccineum]